MHLLRRGACSVCACEGHCNNIACLTRGEGLVPSLKQLGRGASPIRLRGGAGPGGDDPEEDEKGDRENIVETAITAERREDGAFNEGSNVSEDGVITRTSRMYMKRIHVEASEGENCSSPQEEKRHKGSCIPVSKEKNQKMMAKRSTSREIDLDSSYEDGTRSRSPRSPARTAQDYLREEIGQAGPSQEEVTTKGGRPRTTGEYVRRREAIDEMNRAKREAIKLDRERRLGRLSTRGIFKEARISEKECIAETENDPTRGLVSRAKEWMAEVLRISRTSSNLKGYQKSLKLYIIYIRIHYTTHYL